MFKKQTMALSGILKTFEDTKQQLTDFIQMNGEEIEEKKAKLEQAESEQKQAENALKHVSKLLGGEVNEGGQ